MKILLFITSVFLVGCSTMPRKMQGTFSGTKPDFVVVKHDGAVYWSPMSKTDDKVIFVGIGSPTKNELEVPLIVPSTSPFWNSKLTYSPDFNTLDVDWGQDFKGQGRMRSTEYRKNPVK